MSRRQKRRQARLERAAAKYVSAVLEDGAPEAPEWMAPYLAHWVRHAIAETFARVAGTEPAAALEAAREIIAAMAEGK